MIPDYTETARGHIFALHPQVYNILDIFILAIYSLSLSIKKESRLRL